MRRVSSIPTDADPTPADAVRRGARQCFGAGSMVALLLVLTVMPGAAAFAAPEAVGQIGILLQEVVRPRPDRDPREPRVVEVQHEACPQLVQVGTVLGTDTVVRKNASPSSGSERVCSVEVRCEAFAALPWMMDTPPPAC